MPNENGRIGFYRCYSNELKKHLMENEFRYVLIAKDIKSDAVFWLFEKTAFLEDLVVDWNKK